MKLRIKGNSIRMRLMQSEVLKLKQVGFINEEVRFPAGNSLSYELRLGESFDACFENERIVVVISHEEAKGWIDSEDLTLHNIFNTQKERLSILIEKDLECMIPREGEDESDAYPNPKKVQTN